MRSLFLAPHNDDETLFGAFTLLAHKPDVVVVLRSQVQDDRYGIKAVDREDETAAAMRVLGCEWKQLPWRDSDPPWDVIESGFVPFRHGYEVVFAPAAEEGGHDHHNALADLADRVWGDRVQHYMTYTREGKSEGRTLVPFDLEWITLKLRAMACYRSQIETREAGCFPHFMRDMREWYL